MLILFVLLLFLNFCTSSTSSKLNYIVRKSSNGLLSPTCIAKGNERYGGIGWIYQIPSQNQTLPEIESSYVPDVTNDFNCKFSYRERCTKIWTIKNWQIEEKSTKMFDYISDTRWEDFPTIYISNDTKEFQERIEVPNTFRAGFSVRTSENVEVLACEGWNPRTYPCYYFNISSNKIDLYKYNTYPKLMEGSSRLDSYQAYSNILSKDEWRNFIVSFDENYKIQLIDVNLNRTVIEVKHNAPIQPVYLFFNSKLPSLWKIHNNQYLYTKFAQTSRMGPILNLPSSDLCVSLYASTCTNCIMSFFIVLNGVREVLRQEQLMKNHEWSLIRLTKENVMEEKINIFVETSHAIKTNSSEGFWAIDDIRVCHTKEVKISKLKLSIRENDDVVCQEVEHPNLRPGKTILSEIKDSHLTSNTLNSTAIHLSWNADNSNSVIDYFINYKANDPCTNKHTPSIERSKSNGFLVTNENQITLNRLIPYTNYNISLSTILNNKPELIQSSTHEKSTVAPEELPNQVHIDQVTNTSAEVLWDVECQSSIGNIVYYLEVTEKKSNRNILSEQQTENGRKINGLEPFTTYVVKISAFRNVSEVKSKHSPVTEVKFTTKPGMADEVTNLEVYAVSNSSISLRYNLPDKNTGIPELVQTVRCNSHMSKRCKTSFAPLTRCDLYPHKYCIRIENLIPDMKYTLKISLKNRDTNEFGKQKTVETITTDHIPGPPSNITYKLVDCEASCHLNIFWNHPYEQKGRITSFDIILTSRDTKNDDTKSKNITEILPIINENYLPRYKYQIKYVPYGKTYDLYIQSVNVNMKSDFAQISLKIVDSDDKIDQSPKLTNKTDDSFIFQLPNLDKRLDYFTLMVIVQDFNESVKIPSQFSDDIKNNLCHKFGNSWISLSSKISNNHIEPIVIGKDKSQKTLNANTKYCLTFFIKNHYKNSSEISVHYNETLETLPSMNVKENGSNSNHLYALLIFLILIPIGIFAFWYLNKKRKAAKRNTFQVTDYESLRLEDKRFYD